MLVSFLGYNEEGIAHTEHPETIPQRSIAPGDLLQYFFPLEISLKERPVDLFLEKGVY